jgi:ubiquinone biosynthesis protein
VLVQILVNGLFHADPHPGNILVLPGNVVAFVDFGIVGRLDRDLRDRLAQVVLAIHAHDADRLAGLVAKLAVPLRPVDAVELSRDIDEMLDLYANVPIGQLSLRAVFASLSETMARHRLKLPADLLLLIKALSTIEAVGRQLEPDFQMVEHATPFVAGLVAERRSPRAIARRAGHAGRGAIRALGTLPAHVAEIARRVSADGMRVEFVHRNLDFFVREMDRSSNRLSFAVVIGAIVVGSSIIVHADAGPVFHGYPVLGLAGFVTAGVLGIGLALGILRSGRL